MRFLLGPFVDKYGPRIPMSIILLVSAIPTALTGLVNTATGLTVIRFFIGIGGSTFVMAQFWMSTMFVKEWVGTANATVAGWGNLGGGVTQLLVGSVLFPIFRAIYNDDAEKAWRTVCAVPAILGLVTAYCVYHFTDDSPRGNFAKLKTQNQMGQVNLSKSFKDGVCDFNTWFLFIQYACCFGVEIVMNNAAPLFFKEEFGLTTEKAAAIASIFGWMNLFARGLGGYYSDKANARMGMRGRLLWQSFVLFMEGCFVIAFAKTPTLGKSIVMLVFFSIFVQAGEGASFG
jgi:MFS transporter, NNP family, nitrate/nitrite transporter